MCWKLSKHVHTHILTFQWTDLIGQIKLFLLYYNKNACSLIFVPIPSPSSTFLLLYSPDHITFLMLSLLLLPLLFFPSLLLGEKQRWLTWSFTSWMSWTVWFGGCCTSTRWCLAVPQSVTTLKILQTQTTVSRSHVHWRILILCCWSI